MKLLIQKGRLVDPVGGIGGVMDILIEDGKLAVIGSDLREPEAQVLDAFIAHLDGLGLAGYTRANCATGVGAKHILYNLAEALLELGELDESIDLATQAAVGARRTSSSVHGRVIGLHRRLKARGADTEPLAAVLSA